MSEQVLVNRLLEEEYTLGEPWKLPRGTGFVLPILGAPPFPERSYVLLQEALDKVTFTDSGSISRVDVMNRSGSPVYIRKGTVLKAGSQPRSPISGYVLEPIPKTVPLAVNCIHASRGIRAGDTFNVRGLTPHSVYMALGDQGRTWSDASAWSRRTRAGGSGSAVRYASRAGGVSALSVSLSALRDDNIADALDRIEEVKGTVEDVLANIPGDHVNQVGIAVFDLKGVVAVETFDHPDSWRAFSDSITRSYAEILTEESDLYEVKTEKAASVLFSFLRQAAGAAKNLVTSNSVSNIFSLIAEKLSGEIVEIHGKEIHMTLARDERPLMKAGARLRAPRAVQARVPSIAMVQTISGQPYGPDDITHISSWLRKKGSEDILKRIEEQGPQRFSDLYKADLNISKSTLSSRLREGQNLGLIGHLSRRNGSPAYGLTPEGEGFRRQRKQQQAIAR